MAYDYKMQRELFQSPALSFLAFKGNYTRAIAHELRVMTSREGCRQPLNFFGLRPITLQEKRHIALPDSSSEYGFGLSLPETLDTAHVRGMTPIQIRESSLFELQRETAGAIRNLYNCLQIMNPNASSLLISIPVAQGQSMEDALFLRYSHSPEDEIPKITCFDSVAGDIHLFETLSIALIEIWRCRV